jgi:hypothetical protein
MTAQLPQVLVRNSFNILGLSSSSALKEIRKRSQQLLQLAKIEEVQEFDTDIGHVREFRNEGEIRQALERVSGIQERLQEIFFWFDDHSIESRKAVALVSKEDYKGALDIFDKADKANADWLGCKNLALTLMFYAFASSSIDSFCRSLKLWKLIAESDDFWKFYEKHYLLHDELGTSSSLFQEFRSSVCEILSAKAVSFYRQTKNPEAIGACYSSFGRIAKIIDVEILQPVILKVKKEIEELEKIDPESELDATLIRRILKKIHKSFTNLDKFELSEYSPLTVLKNDTAEKLRSISVDIYNRDADSEIARLFLDQSSKLAVSEAVADKIKADKRQLKENDAWQSVSSKFEKVETLIADQRMEEAKSAYLSLDKELAGQSDESLTGARIQLLINYCSLLMEKGHELFEKKKFGIGMLAISGLLNRKSHKGAILAFEHASEILKDRMHLLEFIDPASNRASLSKNMDTISNSLKNCELASLFDHHQSYLQTVEEIAHEQDNENTQIAIKLLGAAVCFSVLYRRFYGITQRKMWKWIGWGAAIAFYFFVIMGNDKPEPKPAYKSSYQSKSSYSASSSSLTSEEKKVIEYLQKNEPEILKNIRKEGYSDKQIARYVIEHADDEEE